MWAIWLIACNGDEEADKEPVCADEVPYDDIDQDCDGSDLVDVDGDTFRGVEAGGPDCNDEDAAIHPDAAEIPYDSIDQDCNGEDLLDGDEDGHLPMDYGGDDCDDANASVYPDAPDSVGNGIDESCDGLDGVDRDADGFASVASGGDDCADDDDTRNTSVEEIWYDGVDQNCDQQCDADQDGDGAVLPGQPIGNNSPCDMAPGPEIYAPQDCNDTNGLVSFVEIYGIEPADGSIDVDTSTAIYAYLYSNDPSSTMTVRDSSGAMVPGLVVGGGYSEIVSFEPDGPLAWFETYEIELLNGCGPFVSSFTTEDEPVPVDASGLLDRTYSVSLATGEWVEPPGVGDLLVSQLGDVSYLVGVVGVGADTLDLRLASGEADVQDLCAPTTEELGVDFSTNPYVTLQPETLSLWAAGIEIPLLNPVLTGRVRSDSTALADVGLSAVLDTVPLGEAFGLGSGDSVVCDLMATFGVNCISCPDGSSPYCLTMVVEEAQGPEVPVTLAARTQEDIDADPACP